MLSIIMLKNLTKQAFFSLYKRSIATLRRVWPREQAHSQQRPTLQAVTVSYLVFINITLDSILFYMYIYIHDPYTSGQILNRV